MSFILGDDIHGLSVEWRPEEGNQNMLTISGNHGSGKTMLADSIMLQALSAQYAVIRFDFEGKPLPPPSSVRLTMKQRPKRWRCLTGRWLKSDGVEHASKSMEWKESRPHVRFCLSSRTWTRSWRPKTDIICVPSRNAYGKSKPESPDCACIWRLYHPRSPWRSIPF